MRYDVSAPLVYRCVGEERWRRGRTENISRSGVLFEAAVPELPAATRIEFIVKLPAVEPLEGAWVQCQGQVVRHDGARTAGECAMAATIDAYELRGVAPEGVPGDVGS